MKKWLFTSESVTEGHPDKIADQVSDAILDAMLEQDPESRVAVETLVATGVAVVAGEVTTKAYVDIPRIVRDTILEIGYTRAKFGFDGETCAVLTSIDEQSPDIALGVNKSLEAKNDGKDKYDIIGAGDQGMMFGYATNETEEMMPLPIVLAHNLARRLATVRKERIVEGFRPDGKTQVTVLYEDGKPIGVKTIVVSTQHDPAMTQEEIEQLVKEHVIKAVVPEEMMLDGIETFVNPTGRFVKGGPAADTGLTGRKIIVDTYGGWIPHGGGAFSGKDPTKVDRSAHYMARYVAKNIVAAGLADRVTLQIAYAIGVAHPVSFMIDAHGTEKVALEKLEKVVKEVFDFRPAAIIDKLNLRRPIYKQVAAYGHFGRIDVEVPWEKLDAVDELKRAFNM
ncbi:methionine adenosyltransferase [Kosmotoga olearia]|uniref:S-adenosylmethionine synthase n=1 Tax=Kosmotoga olearia (strain ATCC BAA-1733 / DSM 21960 / TBF 19.5.1) TaxID=521045 RepID=METK_KOSOT|nr:methionine adenosyltransferase [Kosmotoga olearia]C5CD66.1 RecName: Full=S-adenosylmethionine synthase; Short=AdoMet synthase; AltName: Full=MAT; AltName: Full=Methionine adenosyltransferase [Kosmotoga olearia TBF 19.5.1]ACR79010.1 S-adenosylmethionine synthetase [Kosmotoga olearia TBF 19.5.1]MDK2953448.1 S-adenosylmethionine synthetase [Kosmotoga sp.]